MLSQPNSFSSKVKRNTSRSRLLGTVVILLSACYAAAAQTSPTDGMTPAGMAPGSPAGAYGLSGFDNINLYNGNLNIALPLLGIGGRGGAQTQMTLNLNSVHWQVEKETLEGIDFYYVNPNWWEGIAPGFGPGVLQARNAVVPMVMGQNKNTLTRLTFTAPDGTEYELVDTYRGGQQYGGLCYYGNTRSRGQVFVSHEGSAFVTFVSNTIIYDQCETYTYSDGISGYLYFPDGSRYEIANDVVTKIRDRNGNLMSFAYDAYKRVTAITDSLNRVVTVSYPESFSYIQITYKGFGGAQRSIKVWYTSLGQALRAGYTVQTYGQLFPYVNSSDNTVYNPGVVSSVELPYGRQYQFRYNPYGAVARVVLPTGGAVEYDYVEMAGQSMLSQSRVFGASCLCRWCYA